ncbi:aldehyde-activating protein [Sneathiella sp. P13V-1]|uniref:GFA family protein n=1 Tax=Sneathiella sp. P13V-1 TaxID=2697366 RepID=UPI00187BBFF9|nr:GFA family protein [Sneathiella sp. P13V-1]MBE7637318.1 aldehyde-activating protein [Sneathiella sp. P13V-1]
MAKIHKGSCLCGAVTFDITGEFQQFFLCHCHRCQKGSGSAHGANLFSTEAKLKWLTGEDQITTFNVKGTRHTRSFCKTCGAVMPITQGDLLVVPAGTLDTPVDIKLNGHLFMKDAASWEECLTDAPRFEEFPE